MPVTHRIIERPDTGTASACSAPRATTTTPSTPWTIAFSQPQQARYAYHIPYLGYGLAALSLRPVRMAIIGLPALLIAVSLLWSLWRSAGEEARRQETAAAIESTDRP